MPLADHCPLAVVPAVAAFAQEGPLDCQPVVIDEDFASEVEAILVEGQRAGHFPADWTPAVLFARALTGCTLDR